MVGQVKQLAEGETELGIPILFLTYTLKYFLYVPLKGAAVHLKMSRTEFLLSRKL